MPEKRRPSGRRALWSGTLRFGLVTLPVTLWPIVRRTRPGLRLLGASGAPLRQRYVSGETGRFLDRDEVVRALPAPGGGWAPVSAEELAELRPVPATEIDLQEFVPRDQLDPLLVDTCYLLLPESAAAHGYFLLRAALSREERAGIATFMLRGRRRQLAVIAAAASLQAFTLRPPHIIRTPEEIGVAPPAETDRAARDRFTTAMLRLEEERFDPHVTVSRESRRLTELVLRKLQEKEDLVLPLPEEADGEPPDGEAVFPDLAERLRESIGAAAGS